MRKDLQGEPIRSQSKWTARHKAACDKLDKLYVDLKELDRKMAELKLKKTSKSKEQLHKLSLQKRAINSKIASANKTIQICEMGGYV